MAENVKLTVHADATQAQRELARAHRAMRAAVLRDQITERTSLTALINRATGILHNPACAPEPMRAPTWSQAAHDAIHPKREEP